MIWVWIICSLLIAAMFAVDIIMHKMRPDKVDYTLMALMTAGGPVTALLIIAVHLRARSKRS